MATNQTRQPSLRLKRLKPPEVQREWIRRTQLISKHSHIQRYKLVFISAPQGYGKTIFMTQLFKEYSELQSGWVSLCNEDNNPGSFLTALAMVMDELRPEADFLQPILNPGSGKNPVTLLIDKISEEFAGDELVVFLDNFNAITNPYVHSMLNWLLRHMPGQMHFVIASRHAAPSGLGKGFHGNIDELRAYDLSFTRREVKEVLDLLQMDISNEDLNSLYDRTSGWPAAVLLEADIMARVRKAQDRN